MDTLGSLRTEVLGWLRGDYSGPTDQPLVNAAINDYIEEIWMSMMPVQLARFFGLDSPVTFNLPAGEERVQLVSIPDPTVAPVVAPIAGGQMGVRTYLVVYTYVTESGSETLPSPSTSAVIGLNQVAQVTAPLPVAQAIGWNCYASVTDQPALLGLQNQQPLPFGIVFVEPTTGWVDYPGAQQQPGAVQAPSSATPASVGVPSENTTADNVSWIVQMEVRTSDTLLRSWNQYDVSSELFKRYGRELSSASEYQSYVFDLINGNRLEIRPSAGLAFAPRYFYVAKPRRLRYDKAKIPYGEIAGTHAFIVEKTVAKLKLGVDEYLASQAWDQRSEGTRQHIITALTQELWNKNTRIAPHLFTLFLSLGLVQHLIWPWLRTAFG
jgi:hypothetical protein